MSVAMWTAKLLAKAGLRIAAVYAATVYCVGGAQSVLKAMGFSGEHVLGPATLIAFLVGGAAYVWAVDPFMLLDDRE